MNHFALKGKAMTLFYLTLVLTAVGSAVAPHYVPSVTMQIGIAVGCMFLNLASYLYCKEKENEKKVRELLQKNSQQ